VLPLAPLSPEAADCSPPLVLCDPLLSPWLCAVLPEALLDGEPLDWLLGEPEALDGELLELLEELLELLEELLERLEELLEELLELLEELLDGLEGLGMDAEGEGGVGGWGMVGLLALGHPVSTRHRPREPALKAKVLTRLGVT
jgi:hypothetical protein